MSAVNNPSGLSPAAARVASTQQFQILTERPANPSGGNAYLLSAISYITSPRHVVFRARHRAMFSASRIQLAFGGWNSSGAPNAAIDSPAHNPFEVEAVVQKMGSSEIDYTPARIPVFWNGRSFGEVTPGTLLVSDPCAFDVEKYEFFYIIYSVGTTGPNWYIPQGISMQGTTGGLTGGVVPLDNGDGLRADVGVYSATNFINTFTPFATGPVGVFGYNPNPQRTVALMGDSICSGGSDYSSYSPGGWMKRLMINQTQLSLTKATAISNIPNFSHVHIGHSGISAALYLNRLNSAPTLRLAEYASTILWQFGINDVSPSTLVVMQANVCLAARWFQRRGIKFIACTLLPNTTTTDSYQTVTNQTVVATESKRLAYNSWLRDMTPTGFMSWATFATAAAWVASTVYVVGQTVQTSDGIYQCTVAGTSGSTAPVGASGVGLIGDGTVTWQYVPPSPGMADWIDPAAAVEVNSSNVLTLNGGFWKAALTTNDYTGTLTSVSNSTIMGDTGNTNTDGQYNGYNIRFTSGAAVNGTAAYIISYNPTVALNYQIGGGPPALPATGDGYVLYRSVAATGPHPSTYGCMLIANYLNNSATLSKFV